MKHSSINTWKSNQIFVSNHSNFTGGGDDGSEPADVEGPDEGSPTMPDYAEGDSE